MLDSHSFKERQQDAESSLHDSITPPRPAPKITKVVSSSKPALGGSTRDMNYGSFNASQRFISPTRCRGSQSFRHCSTSIDRQVRLIESRFTEKIL